MNLPTFITGERFLRGPVPMAWLEQAGRLSGKALHVGLYAWHLAGMSRSMTLKLSTTKLQKIGISRQAAYKALAELERQRLLLVERRRGRCATVTILRATKGVQDHGTNVYESTTPA
jgi:hypothetical protein